MLRTMLNRIFFGAFKYMKIEEPNWFDYSEFYDFISKHDYNVFVEVGCWLGHSVSYLAQRIKLLNKPNIQLIGACWYKYL